MHLDAETMYVLRIQKPVPIAKCVESKEASQGYQYVQCDFQCTLHIQ